MLASIPCRSHCRHRPGRARGGYAAMLAMLFLVLFSTLAVGFYSSTTTAVVTADNDRRIALAQQAAESGMDLIRYELAHVAIPPNTPSDQVVTVLATQLAANMNGTRNMGSDVVGISGNVIYIPFNTSHTIPLDAAGHQRFALTITAWRSDIVVKSTGTLVTAAGNPINRSISMDFTAKAVPTSSFDYAVASRGQIVVSKGSINATNGVDPTITALMSDQAVAGAITMTGGSIGGDLNIVSGATANIVNGTVDGVSNTAVIQAQHVHV